MIALTVLMPKPSAPGNAGTATSRVQASARSAINEYAKARRREMYVGGSAVYTIWGNKLSPITAEIYLAKTGVSGQMTDEPVQLPRPGNLFDAPTADEGAHGDFNDQAHPRSLQLWLTKHRRALGGLAAAAARSITSRI